MSDPRDTRYSEQDRIEYDRWLQLLPPGSPYEAIFHLVRLQVKHDTAGLGMAVRGYEMFLIEADRVIASLAPLPEVVSGIRRDLDTLNASILERRKALDARVVALETAPPRAPRWVSAAILTLAGSQLLLIVAVAAILWRLL